MSIFWTEIVVNTSNIENSFEHFKNSQKYWVKESLKLLLQILQRPNSSGRIYKYP